MESESIPAEYLDEFKSIHEDTLEESQSDPEETTDELYEYLKGSTTASKSFVFQYTDLAIIVEEKRFYVHKEVLKNVSPVFKTMLEGHFKEKDQKEITLPGKSYSVFKLFLKIVYLRKYDKLTVRNVIRIYPLMHEYQTPTLQRCEEIMMEYVSDKSDPISSLRDFVGCLCIAERYELEDILAKAITTAAHITPSYMLKYPKYNALQEETRLKIAQTRVTLLESRLKNITTLQHDLQNAEKYIEKIQEQRDRLYCLPRYSKSSVFSNENTSVNVFLKVERDQWVKDNSDSDSNDSDS